MTIEFDDFLKVDVRVGTVVRADWNFTFNGNCVEIRYADGTLARFLHLSRTDVKTGQKVLVACGAARGDLYLVGTVAPHRDFERRGDDDQATEHARHDRARCGWVRLR